MDISWEDAQTFLAVAEGQSFSAAARALQCGQPTISRRIADLEARVGAQLFRRGKQGASLTEAGARLLPAAEQMARWAGEFGRLAAGADATVAGVVRIAAPPGLAVEFMAPFAGMARKQFPEIQIEVLSSIEHVDLSRGAADIAVRTRPPREPELMTLFSTEVGLGVFGSAEYVATLPARPTPDEIDWITWAFPYLHLAPRPFLERLLPNFSPAFSSDDYLVLKSAVASGLGAMILERSNHPLASTSQLVEIDLGITLPHGEMHLVCAKSTQYVPRVRAIADLLIEQLQYAAI
ncbi:MAG: DNA-binding transcriptional LysR family regulator [Myxococcota bacterium]|jgi:DNA-binding transcriptional LysR family regulator